MQDEAAERPGTGSFLLSGESLFIFLVFTAAHRFAGRGRLGRNVIFALEFDTTVNRAYFNYKNILAGNVSHKTTMRISGIFTSRTSMDENISPMVRAPVHLFKRDTRKIIIVLYPKKVHRSA